MVLGLAERGWDRRVSVYDGGSMPAPSASRNSSLSKEEKDG